MAAVVDQAEQLLIELDALLSGPLERAGLGLALEDELRPLLQRAVRRVQADTLDEAARLTLPSRHQLDRMTDAARIELESLARQLRAGAAQVRAGKPWPPARPR